MIEKPKYFNQTMFDKEDFRVGVTVVNSKKLPDGREIDLVFNTKDSVVASNGVYMVLSFKMLDEYVNAYFNYSALKNLKDMMKRIHDEGFGPDPEISEEFTSEKIHIELHKDEENYIKLELYSKDENLMASTFLNQTEFNAIYEIITQLNMPNIQAAYSIAFIMSDTSNKIDLHVSDRVRRQKDKIQRRAK